MNQDPSKEPKSIDDAVGGSKSPPPQTPFYKYKPSFFARYRVHIATITLAALALTAGLAIGRKIHSNKIRTENASVLYLEDSLDLDDPIHFDFIKGPECSRYARLAARQYFGLEYAQKDAAWKMAQANKSVWKADNDPIVLRELNRRGMTIDEVYNRQFVLDHPAEADYMYKVILEQMLPYLQPGHLIGTFFSGSNFNRHGRPYTHLLLYTGVDEGGKHIVHHEFGDGPYATSLEGGLLHFPGTYSASNEMTLGFTTSRNHHVLIPREIIASR